MKLLTKKRTKPRKHTALNVIAEYSKMLKIKKNLPQISQSIKAIQQHEQHNQPLYMFAL